MSSQESDGGEAPREAEENEWTTGWGEEESSEGGNTLEECVDLAEIRVIFDNLLNFDNIYENNQDMDRQMRVQEDGTEVVARLRVRPLGRTIGNIYDQLESIFESSLSETSSSEPSPSEQAESAGNTWDDLDSLFESSVSDTSSEASSQSEPAEGALSTNNTESDQERYGYDGYEQED